MPTILKKDWQQWASKSNFVLSESGISETCTFTFPEF